MTHLITSYFDISEELFVYKENHQKSSVGKGKSYSVMRRHKKHWEKIASETRRRKTFSNQYRNIAKASVWLWIIEKSSLSFSFFIPCYNIDGLSYTNRMWRFFLSHLNEACLKKKEKNMKPKSLCRELRKYYYLKEKQNPQKIQYILGFIAILGFFCSRSLSGIESGWGAMQWIRKLSNESFATQANIWNWTWICVKPFHMMLIHHQITILTFPSPFNSPRDLKANLIVNIILCEKILQIKLIWKFLL